MAANNYLRDCLFFNCFTGEGGGGGGGGGERENPSSAGSTSDHVWV